MRELALVDAYNVYRKEHKLLLPEEIKKIREQYGLSQRKFSKLLNWGIRLFVDMRMDPSKIKHIIVCFCFVEPENTRTYLTENEVILDAKQT